MEAILDEEFPPDEDPVCLEKEETVEEASDRMEKEIEKRFLADQENLSELVVKKNTECQMCLNISFIVILDTNRQSATYLIRFACCTSVSFVFCCCQEHLIEKNIQKMTINTSQRLRVVQRQLIQEIQPLVTNRESLFQKSFPISCTLAQNLLLSSYKHHSGFGCWDPVEVRIIH